MHGSFHSHQYVEIVSGDHCREATFVIELTCTSRGDPGKISGPPEDCYPPEGAEFELDSIQIAGEESKAAVVLTEDAFYALLGQEIADDLIERAEMEAMESGEF